MIFLMLIGMVESIMNALRTYIHTYIRTRSGDLMIVYKAKSELNALAWFSLLGCVLMESKVNMCNRVYCQHNIASQHSFSS